MKAAGVSHQHDNRFAVIRHYEPTRIERELLAQVFEIVSHWSEQVDSRVDQDSRAMISCGSQVAVDAKSTHGLASTGDASRESLEPAA